jgi:hypothetical protein
MYQGWSRSSYLQVTYYLLLLLNGVHEQTSGALRVGKRKQKCSTELASITSNSAFRESASAFPKPHGARKLDFLGHFSPIL